MPSLFTSPYKARRSRLLKPALLRDFSGGWNSVDDDELLNPKFAHVLENFHVGTDGSLISEMGTRYLSVIDPPATGNILNMTHFSDRIMSVMTSGEVVITDANAVDTVIWSPAIAALLPGAPGGWSGGLEYATFVPFKQDMIIHNGVDKPITVNQAYSVTYLQDLATGSNVNVPIGKYGCAVANYHVVAGIPAAPNDLYVSSSGTAGTFVNDPDSDGISIPIAAYTALSNSEVRGVSGFRNFLLVHFRNSTLVITLGNFENNVHVPLYNDTLPVFGMFGQEASVLVKNDLMFVGPTGVASAKRNVFAGLVESKPLTALIDNEYKKVALSLTEEQEKKQVFTILNDAHDQILVFFPNGHTFSYTFNEELKVRGWSKRVGWDWDCGCTTRTGKAFVAKGRKIFQLGNDVFTGQAFHADKINDRDRTWVNSAAFNVSEKTWDLVEQKTFVCNVTHVSSPTGTFADDRALHSTYWTEYLGELIDLVWELPWMDFGAPEFVKKSKYIKIGSKGTGLFTLEAYVDGLYKDDQGEIIHEPALSMQFISQSVQGFGGSPDPTTYGTGRPSQDPRLYGFPLKFKRLKLRIYGSVRELVKINWVNILYARGTFHR